MPRTGHAPRVDHHRGVDAHQGATHLQAAVGPQRPRGLRGVGTDHDRNVADRLRVSPPPPARVSHEGGETGFATDAVAHRQHPTGKVGFGQGRASERSGGHQRGGRHSRGAAQ